MFAVSDVIIINYVEYYLELSVVTWRFCFHSFEYMKLLCVGAMPKKKSSLTKKAITNRNDNRSHRAFVGTSLLQLDPTYTPRNFQV